VMGTWVCGVYENNIFKCAAHFLDLGISGVFVIVFFDVMTFSVIVEWCFSCASAWSRWCLCVIWDHGWDREGKRYENGNIRDSITAALQLAE
jgi:hypothetical protein